METTGTMHKSLTWLSSHTHTGRAALQFLNILTVKESHKQYIDSEGLRHIDVQLSISGGFGAIPKIESLMASGKL